MPTSRARKIFFFFKKRDKFYRRTRKINEGNGFFLCSLLKKSTVQTEMRLAFYPLKCYVIPQRKGKEEQTTEIQVK